MSEELENERWIFATQQWLDRVKAAQEAMEALEDYPFHWEGSDERGGLECHWCEGWPDKHRDDCKYLKWRELNEAH